MSTATTALGARLAAVRPRRTTLAWGALLANTELVALWLYLQVSNVTIYDPLPVLSAFIWLNVGLWALVRTDPPAASVRQRYIAGAIAVGYFAVLAYVGGLVGPATAGGGGLRFSMQLPPGYSPTVFYGGGLFDLALMPYKVVGYAALAYLVYATALDAAGALVGGVVGIFSCVSCTFPVLATVATSGLGSGTAVANAVYANSYSLSAVVFVGTVALLYWRPAVGGD
jgi:hypothetical protein